jgi:hypothetical protein
MVKPQQRFNLALSLQRAANIHHPVRRSVVNYDHLHGTTGGQEGLLGQCLDTGPQRPLFVVANEYDA